MGSQSEYNYLVPARKINSNIAMPYNWKQCELDM